MIITIDGPSGTGKSTIAKKLAEAIGFIFFDTGAMYRTLTYGIIKHQIDFQKKDHLQKFLDDFLFEIKVIKHQRHYFFEGEDISDKIRLKEVTQAVSAISALKPVRDKLMKIQREFSEGVNAVFEGRDMGTIVFPDATLKIFLTGRNEVRAKRRYEEMRAKYPEEARHLSLEKCLEEINKRDTLDSTREHAPLRQAQDAYVIDTSDLSIDEVLYKILEYKDALKTKRPH